MARGGKALTDAARVGLTMASMTPDEASSLGVAEAERWQHVRIDDQKVNMAPRAERAQWFRLETQQLGNGTEMYPRGDVVAALVPWTPPSVFRDIPATEINAVLDVIEGGLPSGGRYSPSRRGKSNGRWVGFALMQHLGVGEDQAANIASQWLKTGLLVVVEERDSETRKVVSGVRVVATKRPGVRA